MIEEKWHPISVDFIEVALATINGETTIIESAKQRFGIENEVVVRNMRWLSRLQPGSIKQHASAVVKLATKQEVEKLLQQGFAVFGGMDCQVREFKEVRNS